MSDLQTKELAQLASHFKMIHPLPKHFEQIQALCKRVYPFSKPWNIEQLESHRSYFPDGQLIVIDEQTEQVIGLAFSLIIVWNDYSPQDNWQDFTSAGYFHNHNPREGKTLYGAEVMVDPAYRGRGIGRMLYEGRREIAYKYDLKRIRAGARLRGYAKFAETLTPDQYVKQVMAKKIYDPTLSFQLSQGFQVIDVAPNYLFNDPESLGYAAVIEWLNPKTSSAKELEKQQQRVEAFMSDEKFVPQHLPRELRHLVRKATSALGNAILDLEGDRLFSKIEYFREHLIKTRSKSQSKDVLETLLKKLKQEPTESLFKLAHAFSLQLEIVNMCEAAYRTWKQRQKPLSSGVKNRLGLTYVLTAHPTEARSKEVLETFASLQKILVDGVQNRFLFNDHALSTQMRKLWLQTLSKKKKPTVLDEAEYIYSLIFPAEILDFIVQDKPGYDLKLRTWVGGDKDGHPGVDKTVMKECLSRSRHHLLSYASQKLAIVISDLENLHVSNGQHRSEIDSLRSIYQGLGKFSNINSGDGNKIKTWKVRYRSLLKKSSLFLKKHEQILLLNRLLDLFPALVLPIELREDSQLIKSALTDSKAAIREMLAELSRISGALGITSYARGLVISHCETDQDIGNACSLVELVCHSSALPVIPLFESREALLSSKKILTKWLSIRRNHDRIQRHWGQRLEIMLGYSDSAKQTGVLPSRLLIAKAMQDLDRTLRPLKIKPVFFHGSGGSVARGGGSLKEQISWWSQAAIENPKMTIQGEMIQRLFASKEILNSQCVHLTTEARRRKVRKLKLEKSPELERLAQTVTEEYQKLVTDQDLLATLLNAGPYAYLDYLKIGSRPSKRPASTVSLSSLRAIPWVLCWTQTRLLLPTWWGVGTAWTQLSSEEKEKLKELFSKDPFFSSFIKTLAFTLAKVELDIWDLYLKRKDGESALIAKFHQEFTQALRFVREVSQQKQLLWYRPWLDESIRLRSPHIHILNLIQMIAMDRSKEDLLRETIVGIACGMLTTG